MYLETGLRIRLRELKQELNDIAGEEAVLSYNLDALRRDVITLRRTVFELGVMTTVALEMLAEAGPLELDVLKYRVEAELDALDASRAAAPPQVTCVKCHREVPAAQTDITERGPVCNQCA